MREPHIDYRPLKQAINLNVTEPAAHQVKTVCPSTGILAHISLPAIKEVVFTYSHPLASLDNCLKLIHVGQRQLAAMDTSILAGMILTCYRHYGLLELRGTALEANRLLQTIPSWELAKALHLVAFINHTKASVLPHFSLDWATHKDDHVHGFASHFNSWLNLLQEELLEVSELETMMMESVSSGIPVYEIHGRVLTNQLNLARAANQRMKEKRLQERLMSQTLKEAESEFKKQKSRFKELVAALAPREVLPLKLMQFLQTLSGGDNLKALPDGTRDKLISRLTEYQLDEARELIRILQATSNPFDLFDTHLDAPAAEMEEKMQELQKPRTLAEILAAKKAGEMK
jgi:hypothetical protein